MSVTASIGAQVVRELRTVKREIEAYPDEASIWAQPSGVPNSAGNLALHLAGNLQTYIGAALGKTGYVRNRPAEFSRRDVPRADVLRELDAAIAAVTQTFASLDDSVLDGDYPGDAGKWALETGDFLIHLLAHLNYHLGQIDYHRRIVTGNAAGVDAVQIREMLTAKAVPA
jgi:uncharacterized damage-inducible protein DinB